MNYRVFIKEGHKVNAYYAAKIYLLGASKVSILTTTYEHLFIYTTRAILSYFIWVADFFLVPGRDKYTMWDRRPLGQNFEFQTHRKGYINVNFNMSSCQSPDAVCIKQTKLIV